MCTTTPPLPGEGPLDEPGRAAAGEHRTAPAASPSSSRHRASSGADHEGRRLQVVAVVARRARRGRPTPGRRPAVAQWNGGVSRVKVRASKGSGSTMLADAGDPGPAADHAEGTSAPEAGLGLEVGVPGPPQDAAASAEPAAQAGARWGSACRPRRRAVRPTSAQRPAHQVVVGHRPAARRPDRVTRRRPSPSLTTGVSARSRVTISASIRWKPSARTPVTRSDRVSLAGRGHGSTGQPAHAADRLGQPTPGRRCRAPRGGRRGDARRRRTGPRLTRPSRERRSILRRCRRPAGPGRTDLGVGVGGRLVAGARCGPAPTRPGAWGRKTSGDTRPTTSARARRATITDGMP